MRYNNQGSCFRVSYSKIDTEKFAKRWPCSAVKGSGWYEYNEVGDLVDCSHDEEGEGWLAFSEDCQNYGNLKHSKSVRRSR